MDSAMETLRREIIGQELIFRNQVHELHRLYWTQKNMMSDLRVNGVNAHKSKGKNAFSEQSRHLTRGAALDGKVGIFMKNDPRSFDLQLSAYDFIVGAETGFSKSNRGFQADCGLQEEIVEKGLRSSDSFRCIEVIDLEDSADAEYHEANKACANGFRILHGEAPALFGSQLSVQGNIKYYQPSMVHLDEEQDRGVHGPVSCVGLGHSNLAAGNDLSCIKQRSRPVLIDLNIPNQEDYYNVEDDHSPSMNFSIHHHQNLELEPTKNNMDNNNSFTSNHDSPKNSSSITTCKNSSLALDSETSVLAYNNSKVVSTNADEAVNTRLSSSTYEEDSLDLSQTQSRILPENTRNVEGMEEDSLSGHSMVTKPDEFNTKFCAEYSCNEIMNNSECSSYEKSIEEPATLSVTDESIITQIHSPKHEISYLGKSKIEGRDAAIAAAAEVLMTITFGRSEELENSMEEVQVQCDEPQTSSDSFEFMAMQLPEVQNEERILMGEMSGLDGRQKDENGIRLRRGRRIRDFRKEILPGLVSLSRHEIWEDLYNIGYCLRKNTPKKARENWFLPVRNRRSRQYFGS